MAECAALFRLMPGGAGQCPRINEEHDEVIGEAVYKRGIALT